MFYIFIFNINVETKLSGLPVFGFCEAKVTVPLLLKPIQNESSDEFHVLDALVIKLALFIVLLLFTNNSTAWAQTEKDDASLIKYMKLGNTMIVKGISSRGTNTKDTYSLKGFVAAYKAMNKKCQ